MEELKKKKFSVPREEYVLIVLGVLDKFEELSAKEISEKLKDKKTLEKLGILDQSSTKIPSYSTVCRILKFLYTEKNMVKWIQQPTKERKYKITKEGKMFLAGRQCEGEDNAALLFNPQDCSSCEENHVKECWEEKIKWLQELIKKGHFGKSLSLKDSEKPKIMELFNEPSSLAQVCAYYELREQIDPFFEKHLKHLSDKVKSLCKS